MASRRAVIPETGQDLKVPAPVRIVPLPAGADRTAFSCGVDALDRYLREQATQDTRRRVGNCFVAIDDRDRIAGYYTMAATSLELAELPEGERKRLPRYPLVPAALIGRLAVDRSYRGRGLGAALMVDAVQRAASADPAIFALVVDAKDEEAIGFYRHLGFRSFAARAATLFVPVATMLRDIPPVRGA